MPNAASLDRWITGNYGEGAWREPSDADLDEQLFAADQAEAADAADELALEAEVAAYAAACDTAPPVTDPAEDLWALLGRVVTPPLDHHGRRT